MDVKITENNKEEILRILAEAKENALTMIGMKIENYAKKRCPVGTPESTGKKGYMGGTLRNSITYKVEGSSLTVGSNVFYAPFVELGTGPYFDGPPAWIEYSEYAATGGGTGYVKPRPFLRPAIEDHMDLYKRIMKDQIQHASEGIAGVI